MEFGWFFLISCLISVTILKQIKGKPSNLNIYFASKKWPFMNSSKSLVFYSTFLKIIIYFFIVNPIITLLIWGITLLQDETAAGGLNVGYSILVLGSAIIVLAILVLLVQLSNFKINKCSTFLLLVSIGLF